MRGWSNPLPVTFKVDRSDFVLPVEPVGNSAKTFEWFEGWHLPMLSHSAPQCLIKPLPKPLTNRQKSSCCFFSFFSCKNSPALIKVPLLRRLGWSQRPLEHSLFLFHFTLFCSFARQPAAVVSCWILPTEGDSRESFSRWMSMISRLEWLALAALTCICRDSGELRCTGATVYLIPVAWQQRPLNNVCWCIGAVG